jgi:hypothetical protein
VTIEIDGRKVGQAQGVNTVNQWLDAGWVYLHAGTHRFTVIRPGGGLAPGDGGVSWLGPGAILERGPERLERLPVSSWRSLCGRTLDWVELVRG